MDIKKKFSCCHQKLEQWRIDCHQKIDHLFEQKCRELEQIFAVKIKKQQEEINQIHAKLTKITYNKEANQQEIDLLTSSIRCLEVGINNIEQTGYEITIQPLVIDAHSITFKEQNVQEFDLSAHYPIHKTIPYTPGSCFPLASSNHHLLFHQAPNLSLVNQEFILVKQVIWPYGVIWDTCWSSTLNGFIVITQTDMYLIDEKRMSIENILKNPKQNSLACTCSDTYLFVSTNEWGSSIIQFNLSLTIDIVQQWESPKSCTKDECIDVMIYNNNTLALVIRNIFERSIRIELRFPENFDCIWSLQLDAIKNLNQVFKCCSLMCGEWLVINPETQQLLQITKSGTLKKKIKCNRVPHRISLFGEKILVVAFDTSLNFYKLKLDT